MTDQDIMARTIYGEARGEGIAGMQAVANVILNRFSLWDSHPHFGNGTIESVCLAPWQFSCWNENDPNLPILKSINDSDPVFIQCFEIAGNALEGSLADNTNGATFYYVRGSKEPTWAFGKDPCASIGRHLFFTNIA